MKKTSLLLLFIFVLLPVCMFSQIPNPGFESWTNGEPDGWVTDNSSPDFVPITQSSSAHSGSSAMQGTVVEVSGITLSPSFVSGADGEGFPVSSRPASIQGWYKLISAGSGGDMLNLAVGFYKGGQPVGATFFVVGDAASYTQFSSDITWISPEVPDTAIISGLVINGAGGNINVGTTFYLDDLTFSSATAVQPDENTALSFELAQNYPNPFNPTTTISYTLPKSSFVTLKVYNLLGQEVAELVNETQFAGKHSVEFTGTDLPSGLYIYKITAGNFSQTRKMMLLK
jgi:hypothetical protein